jgi:hypothetical protein
MGERRDEMGFEMERKSEMRGNGGGNWKLGREMGGEGRGSDGKEKVLDDDQFGSTTSWRQCRLQATGCAIRLHAARLGGRLMVVPLGTRDFGSKSLR